RGGREALLEDLRFGSEAPATAETCLGTECPRYDDCFVTRMRQRAAASDLVIVNHHLLSADAAVRQNAFGEVIPSCSNAVLDEAHQLEEVATQYFGYSVSTYRLEELARDVEHLGGAPDATKTKEETVKGVRGLRAGAREFFAQRAEPHRAADRGRGERLAVRTTADALVDVRDAAAHLTGAIDVVEATL